MTSIVAAIVWTGVVVHHTATLGGTVESIDRYHREVRGWDCIGYHYVIYTNGTIATGRPLTRPGAHARGRNRTHIGIALIGMDHFTAAQVRSLTDLLCWLCERYPIDNIERHHAQCPGAGLDLENISKKARGQ